VQKGVCDTFLFKWDSKIVEEILPEIFSYYGNFYFIQTQKNKNYYALLRKVSAVERCCRSKLLCTRVRRNGSL